MTQTTWTSRTPWPSPSELLLLQAALLEGDPALRAWRRFCSSETGVEDLSYGAYRLLPQLWRTLRTLDPENPALGRLKGAYRHAWYANQQLLNAAANAIALLQAEGIDVMLLKGAALVALYLPDVGLRPMDDVDILVRPDDAPKSLRILRANGWEPEDCHSIEQIMRSQHAIELCGSGRAKLDLHWSALHPWSCDTLLWDGAIPVSLRGVPVHAPNATEQLLVALAHGLGWNPAPVRWITDAMLIMRAAGDRVDWQYLVGRARTLHVTLELAAALDFLRREFSLRIPDHVEYELRSGPVGAGERVRYRVKSSAPRQGPLWKIIWSAAIDWDVACRLAAAPATLVGHPEGTLDFLRERHGLRTRRAVVTRAVRVAMSWLRPAATS